MMYMNYRSTPYTVFKIMNIVLLSILVLAAVFPYVNAIALALNDPVDTMKGGITVFPRVLTFENFKILIRDPLIANAAMISVFRVAIGTTLALIVQFTCAYAFIIKGVKWRNAILMFLMLPMFFGGGLIPIYLLYSRLGLLNNFWVYVLPISFSLYNTVIIRTYLYTIPDSLAESARIDGANEILIMLKIYIPLSMPIIAVIALWAAVGHWNDWTTTLFFVTNRRLFTMQYMLMQILKEGERLAQLFQDAVRMGIMMEGRSQPMTPQAIRAANIIITTLPIIMIYPFLQKYFVKGIVLGAVKE